MLFVEARFPLPRSRVVSSGEVVHFVDVAQKQVGQTIVQLVQERHRFATSSQRAA